MRNARYALALSYGIAVMVGWMSAGCWNGSAVAGEEDEREGASASYAQMSYEQKVEVLKAIADEPDIRIDDAPAVGSQVNRSEARWKSQLSGREFRILRESGTERPGSGDLLSEKRRGVYRCAACGAPLFSSTDKFSSGTGWPSFTAQYEPGRLGYSKDGGVMSYRVEVHCDRCGGHLGHVFGDGPEPTGKRFCINAAALDFEPVSEGAQN